jgi:hypothetical protein
MRKAANLIPLLLPWLLSSCAFDHDQEVIVAPPRGVAEAARWWDETIRNELLDLLAVYAEAI